MAKGAARYVCQSCGASHPRWSGRCDACGEWNTIVEELVAESAPKGLSAGRGRKIDLQPLEGESAPAERRQSGIAEFDRVCGGGLVKGSALLIGGDPGIGKSTLLLQVAAAPGAPRAAGTIYISGEEAIEQVRLRARRLGLGQAPVAAGGRDLRARHRLEPRKRASRRSWSSSIPSRPCMSTPSNRRRAPSPRSAPRRPS